MPLPILRPKQNNVKKIVGVAAGKGGVGKSFIAAALARSLVKKGYKTGLLDADFYGPSLHKMISEEKLPSQEGDMIIPANSEGLSFVSVAHFLNKKEGLSVRAPIVSKWARRFIQKTFWGDLDYLIIDFPPGTGDIPLELSQITSMEGVILVTTPQEIALIDVRKSAKMFFETGVPVIGIIENMSYFEEPVTKTRHELFGTGAGEILANELKVPLMAKLPLEPEMGRLSDLGFSFFLSDNPKFDPFKIAFEKIHKIMDQFQKPTLIKKMIPAGSFKFDIEWQGGKVQRFDLSKLEGACPCAGCISNDNSSKELIPNLTAKGISLVGSYALKIDFEKGCQNGIYTFEYLQKIGDLP